MKKVLKSFAMLALFTLVSSILFAQEKEEFIRSTPRWISDRGYWVIESNIKTPDTSVVHFYNNNNLEVYAEKLQGITLNLKKRKTLMGLKKVLDESLVAWEQSHLSKDNTQLVANVLKK
jgi:hypothetical protein